MTARDSWLRKSGYVIAASAMALVLFLSVIVAFFTGAAAQGQRQRVDTVRSALLAVVDLRAAVTEAEAGVDDYVMSGGVTGRQLYQDAQAHVSGDMRLLTSLQGVASDASSDIAQIQRLAPTYLSDLRSVISLEQTGQTAAAMQRISTGDVEREAQALREIITRTQTETNSALRNQVTSAEEAQRLVTTVFFVTTLIDLISFAAILILVRRTSALREQFAQERTRAEERARAEALEETNRRMTEFLGVASHEIRTPLTSLKIGLQLAAREIQRTAAEGQPREGAPASMVTVAMLLDRALASTANLERLTADLVDATRIETSELMLSMAPLDLNPLVRDCVAEQRLYHPGRTITLSMPDRSVIVLADTDRIRQAITNYLINALKFSDEERPVEVKLSADEREAMARVRDEGPGIPPEERSRIWDRFYRAPGIMHKTGSSEGFGLGLYICKSIIERHGGAVGVESVVGQGSTFWFTLPLAIAPEAQEATAAGPGAATMGAADPTQESEDEET